MLGQTVLRTRLEGKCGEELRARAGVTVGALDGLIGLGTFFVHEDRETLTWFLTVARQGRATLAAGLAFLAKGPVAALFLAIYFVAFNPLRERSTGNLKRALAVIGLGILPVAAWALLAANAGGDIIPVQEYTPQIGPLNGFGQDLQTQTDSSLEMPLLSACVACAAICRRPRTHWLAGSRASSSQRRSMPR